jgi:aminopeptidase N
VWADLTAADFVGCVTAAVADEPVDGLVEPYLSLAVEAADSWSPDSRRDELLAQVADVCIVLADNPLRRQVALRALAQTAVTDEHLAALRSLAGDDIDLRWRILVRLAEIGSVDAAEVEQLQAADPDPDAWVRALAVDSARPDPAMKDITWRSIVDEHRVPMGALGHIRRAFWRRSQGDILAPYAERYLRVLPVLHVTGMIPALTISGALYPRAGEDAAFAARAVEAARAEGVAPAVARTVIEQTDRLNRQLRTRAL